MSCADSYEYISLRNAKESIWHDARVAFQKKARDKKITKDDLRYEIYWSFYQAGFNLGKEAAK